MEIAELHRLVDELAGLDPAERDRARLQALFAGVRRLRSWCDGREVAITRAVAAVDALAERSLAGAGKCSTRDVSRNLDRSRTAEQVPGLGEALDRGDVSAAHVDATGKVLGTVDDGLRDELAARLDDLVDEATSMSADDWARRARAEADRLRGDDGMGRWERQRRDARVRTWVDQASGMWCLSGRFDPRTGVELEARLQAQLDAVRARPTPELAPDDPIERVGFLRAQALAELLTGTNLPAGLGAASRPGEVVVVVDTTSLDAEGRPRVDWGLPVDLPLQAVADLLAAGATMRPVVVDGGRVVAAPGEMNLGTKVPLATRDQRRVLRALYPSCTVGECDVPFDRCEVHHVTWRRHGGPTDLANLRPVCIRDHHRIHDHGWQLAAHPDGSTTTVLPDGTRMHRSPATARRPPPGDARPP
jgi:hypothetical protein